MSYSKNIRTYYFYSVFTELIIMGPIMVLFMVAKGLSFTQIMLLQSISAISIVLFEVPTGAIADKVSRKLSVFLGALFWALGLLVYILGKKFIVFAAAEIIFSLGSSLKSGADSALIYDSLKAIGREKEYSNVEGRARSYCLYAQAIGSIISGFAYEINMYLPVIISILFMLTTAVIVLFFKEPPLGTNENTSSSNYCSQIIDSGKYILNHSKIKAIVLFSMVFFIFYRTGFWYFQPYMEGVKIPVKYFGVIFFIFNITAAFTSKRSHYIMEKTKPKTLTFMASLMLVSFLIMGTVKIWPGVFAILLQQIARGMYRPITTKYLNKHIPSDKRATILSFSSLCSNITVAIAFPFMGMLKDSTDIFKTHLVTAGIMFVMMCGVIKYMNGKIGMAKDIKLPGNVKSEEL